MDLFEWGNISTGVYVALIIVGIIMYINIFHLDQIFSKETTKKINKWSYSCAIKCDDEKQCKKYNNLRDKNYSLDFDEFGSSKLCKVTKWEVSHFILHLFLGYFTNIYISQGTSIIFELYEHYVLDCGSYLDLGYNLAGFLTGYYLKNYIIS